jgi:HNH endonuclease
MPRRRPPISSADYRIEDRGFVTPCWIWKHFIRWNGYADVSHQGKKRRAHVVSYLERVGSIPEGLELDHLCRQRACVNPDHLEPVTRSENLRRSPLVGRGNRRSQCRKGHPFDLESTYVDSRGGRHCRTCDRIRAHERRRQLGRPVRLKRRRFDYGNWCPDCGERIINRGAHYEACRGPA